MPSVKKRGGLGRGLNALVSEAEYETGGSAASASNAASETKLPIEDIVPNPNQPRIHFNETELRELSESIQEHGVLQPLLVRKHGNGYEIIAGERRYQASKLAGLEELPVIIKDVNDEEMLALALIENLQRSDLNPVEEAKGYRQLIDASGMTQEALSKAVSKSRSAITNSLRLLDLPEVVQQMIFEGKLTAGHARAILAVPIIVLSFASYNQHRNKHAVFFVCKFCQRVDPWNQLPFLPLSFSARLPSSFRV